MEFEFTLPIVGEKLFTIEAESLEEAIYIMCNGDVDGEWTDMDFDIDIHETLEQVLRSQHD